jgi:hypothetical protein
MLFQVCGTGPPQESELAVTRVGSQAQGFPPAARGPAAGGRSRLGGWPEGFADHEHASRNAQGHHAQAASVLVPRLAGSVVT